MDETKDVAAALHALVKNPTTARKKIGRLRELLPEIDALQAAGVPHLRILEVLNERGFELTMSSYSVMLWRIRNGKSKQAETAAVTMPKPEQPKGTEKVIDTVSTAPVKAVEEPIKSATEFEDENEYPEDVRKRREEKADRFIKQESNPLISKFTKGNKT